MPNNVYSIQDGINELVRQDIKTVAEAVQTATEVLAAAVDVDNATTDNVVHVVDRAVQGDLADTKTASEAIQAEIEFIQPDVADIKTAAEAAARLTPNTVVHSAIAQDTASPLDMPVDIPEIHSAEGKYTVFIENNGNANVTVLLQNGTLFGDSGTMAFGNIVSSFQIEPNEIVILPVNSWLIGDAAKVYMTSASNISASVEVRSL